jgi:hypothetical protein
MILAECERPLFDDDMSFLPLNSGGLGRPCHLLRHRSRWRIRPRIRCHCRRPCGPPSESISPCSGGPSIIVLSIITAAVGYPGLVIEMSLAAATAEASTRPAVPPIFPGLASGSWVASTAAVATTSVTAPTLLLPRQLLQWLLLLWRLLPWLSLPCAAETSVTITM